MLNESKARLREVEEGIASLQAKYEECVAKKQELGDKCDLCTARLERAEKVQYSYVYKDVIIIHVCMYVVVLLNRADRYCHCISSMILLLQCCGILQYKLTKGLYLKHLNLQLCLQREC